MIINHPYLRVRTLKTTPQGKSVLIGLAILHSALIVGIISLIRGYLPLHDLALHASIFVFSGLGVAAGYHRLMTHRAYRAHPLLKLSLLIGGSVAMMGPVLLWVATHTEHHRHTDRPGDPHSARPEGPGILPRLKAFAYAHMGWMARSQGRTYLRQYLRLHYKDPNRLSRDPIVRFANRTSLYWAVGGFVVPFCWGIGFGGVGGGIANLFESVIRSCLTLHVIWLVNSLGHTVGERPFRTNDLSTNWWDPVLLIASFGELLHNNHHAFQNRAYYGLKWWQIDLAGLHILFCRSIGLATHVKLISREEIQRKAVASQGR
jgi:stearoyl-CoA desaturase (delta-9 desaturase)